MHFGRLGQATLPASLAPNRRSGCQ